MKSSVYVVRHPLVQHKLTLMRKKTTSVTEFRELVGEVAMLMAYEVTKDLPLTKMKIQTPMEKMMSPVLQGEKMVLVPILRAGMGLLDGMLRIFPSARVAHIGIYRDHKTLEPVECSSPLDSFYVSRFCSPGGSRIPESAPRCSDVHCGD
jgi:uracil phosphoribosyltransferase